MAFTFSDNFNRANGTVGSNWSPIGGGSPQTIIVGNQLVFQSDVPELAYPTAMPHDCGTQECELEFRSFDEINSGRSAGGLFILAQTAVSDGYFFTYNKNYPNFFSPMTVYEISMTKFNSGGSPELLVHQVVMAYPIGTVFKLRGEVGVLSTRIILTADDEEVFNILDSEFPKTSGVFGIGPPGISVPPDNSTWDNFSGTAAEADDSGSPPEESETPATLRVVKNLQVFYQNKKRNI